MRWVLVVVGLGCVAACTATPPDLERPGPAPSRGSPPVQPVVAGECPADGAGLVPPFEQAEVYAGSLPPDGFRPTGVVRCVVADSATQRDDGSMIHQISQETGTLTTELVQRLRWPDSAPPTRPDAACEASARPILYLLLVDTAGRGYRPRIPLDWCGEPRPEVTQAVQAVEWRTTGTYEVTRRP